MAEKERLREMGPGGACVCPACGGRVVHPRGVPCQEEPCPKCGARMLREGSRHHRQWMERGGPR